MKYYPGIEMETGGNHDFPRLARESGFYFNLYCGCIDWKQIDALDIDRLIRERDLESLQSVFASISSCNLTNEYNVKLLDPNFVKLFRLAQLSVDYLQYCRNYLDHCVVVLQEQLRVALHEVEQLQQERQTKEDQIKQLTRKVKEKAKLAANNGLSTNIADLGPPAPGVNSGFSQQSFRCVPCKKVFVSAIFLQRHIMRRHPEQVKLYSEAESLRLEVHQLQERLQKAEELLKQANFCVEVRKKEQTFKEKEEEPEKGPREDVRVDRSQNTDEELCQWNLPKDDNTPTSSQQSEEGIRALMENVKRQSDEIEALKSQLKSQHFAQESLWQNRLDQLEQRHHSDFDALRTTLSQSNSRTTPSPSIIQLGSTAKELHEKQVQISRPEMVVKGTQVESTPNRIMPPPVQEAFTKPVSSPNQAFSSSTKTKPLNFYASDRRKTEDVEVARNEGSPAKSLQYLLTPRAESAPVPESQYFSRMSGDVSLTETSTEETSESVIQECLSRANESESGESSGSTEDGMKKLSSLAIQPQVLTPLRKDIEGVMYRSLRELGIDPEWKGVPAVTYHSVKANLQHQRSITQKGRRGLIKLREDLSREVDYKTKGVYSASGSHKDNHPVRKSPARPPPPRRSPTNKPGNEYTAEPKRERPVPSTATAVYEEVKSKEHDVTAHKVDEQDPPIPPVRRRSGDKVPIEPSKPTVPVALPRLTPSTAELLADMEKLRQQGTLLKAEGSFTTKSNLKSTSSTGNLAKKRVAFLDERDDFPTVDFGLNDGGFGSFQSRNTANTNASYLNKDRSLSASNISRDTLSNFDTFSTNGSGELVRPTGETKVVRMAREVESQLKNKPRFESSHLPSTLNRRHSELDLMLDDLSSS